MTDNTGAPKRLFTNSMLSIWRSCKAKYRWVYLEQLAPMSAARPLRYGDLAHLMLKLMYTENRHPGSMQDDINCWIREAVDRTISVLQSDGWARVISPEEYMSLPNRVEKESFEIAMQVRDLVTYFWDHYYTVDRDRWIVLWCEQRFEVPFINRSDARHKTWRYAGKWDLVVYDTYSGRIMIIDHKTTANKPSSEAIKFQYSTQPVGYSFAGLYLATRPLTRELAAIGSKDLYDDEVFYSACEAISPDLPFWPRDLAPPSGFMINAIRKKVPVKPEKLKSKTKDGKARLSKSKGVDTTHELYMQAILENDLNPADYADILTALENRGDPTVYREEISVSGDDIVRWVHESREELEAILRAERDPARHCVRNPSSCHVFSLCRYNQLCWGDEKTARSLFIHRPAHSELL